MGIYCRVEDPHEIQGKLKEIFTNKFVCTNNIVFCILYLYKNFCNRHKQRRRRDYS